MKKLIRPGLAILSGLLLVLSFPKFGHSAVAWIALVPLLAALRAQSDWGAARLGLLAGFVASVGLLYWTAIVAAGYGGLGLPTGIGVMLLMSAVEALFVGLFVWATARSVRVHGAAALLLAPLTWVATEVLRAYSFFRFPWCLLGYSQHDNLLVIQIAAYTAVYGVSFLVVAPAAVVAYVAAESGRTRRRFAVAGLIALLGAVVLLGFIRLRVPVAATEHLRVGLVQASIPQDEKWQAELAWQNIRRHAELSHRARQAGARLVVWPESAVPYYYDWTPQIASAMNGLARGLQAYILFGNDDREFEPVGRAFVGAKLVSPGGELRYRYHKMRLVPFGEYVPMARLLERVGVHKLVREVGAFSAGDDPAVGEVDGQRFGVTICYEAIFADLVRQSVARGADLLINITNDGWYGRTSAPYQHFAMARFRAVENGKYLLRAANTGISAVVDPRGRVVIQTGLFERTFLVANAGISRERTFYSQHGDWFAWGCLVAAVALMVSTIRRPPAAAGPRS